MSKLSKLLNAAKADPLAVAEAVKDVRQFVGRPVTADTPHGSIEDLHAAIQAALSHYLTARLGPAFGPLAATMATSAVHGILDRIEMLVRGRLSA